jgi:hypothetical protein
MLTATMALAVLFTATAGLAQMGCGMMGAGGHGGHGKEEARETHGRAESGECPMMGGACERWMGSPTFYLDRVEDLGLSAEQVASLRAIRLAYEKDAAMRQAEVRTAELEVEEALSQGQVDVDVVEGKLQQAVKAWTAWRLKRILAGKQALDVLTLEQRTKAGASLEPTTPSQEKEGHEGHKGHGSHMMRYGILGGVAMATVMAVEHFILRR